MIAVIAVANLYLFEAVYDKIGDMYQGIYIEAAGATMDIVVFGIIIAVFESLRRKRVDIKRQTEIIDDFKK